MFPGVADEVPDDEEVVDVAHALDDAHLVLEARARAGRRRGITPREPLLAPGPEEGGVVGDALDAEARQAARVEVEVEVEPDALGDAPGRQQGVGEVGEKLLHLRRAAEEKVLRRQAHAGAVIDGAARVDADVDVVGSGVLLREVVNIGGGDQRRARRRRQGRQGLQKRLLLGQAVAHDLQEEVLLPENLLIPADGGLGLGGAAFQRRAVDFAAQTGAEADEAFVGGCQQFLVDARPVVEALGVRLRGEPHEVAVAGGVAHEQDQMGGRLPGSIVARTRRDVGLHADDRCDARAAAALVELDGAEHVAVVREGEVGHAELGGAAREIRHPAGAVKQAVMAVDVQMHEIAAFHRLHRRGAPRRPRFSVDRRPIILRRSRGAIARRPQRLPAAAAGSYNVPVRSARRAGAGDAGAG